jgi:hypothetical protein
MLRYVGVGLSEYERLLCRLACLRPSCSWGAFAAGRIGDNNYRYFAALAAAFTA